MTIERGHGDLIEVEAVNTVLGKGLALQIENAFPAVFAEYARACKQGEVTIGRHVHRTSIGLATSLVLAPI